MLLILIPLAWLAIAAMLVVLCRAAARADAPPAPGVTDHLGSIGERLVLGEGSAVPRLAGTRSLPDAASRRQATPPLTPRRPAPRRRITAHGIR